MKQKWKERLEKSKCPLCRAKLKIIEGKYNTFIGCSRFPYCKFSISMKKFKEWAKTERESENLLLDKSLYIYEKYDVELPPKLAELLFEADEKIENGGYVYFIRILNAPNLIKIGRTNSFIDRLLTLDSEHQGIVPVWILKTKFYGAMEIFFHQLFEKFLVEGNEYFNIPLEYLIEITKIKTFLGEPVEIINKFTPALLQLLEQRKCDRVKKDVSKQIEKKSEETRRMWKQYYKEQKTVNQNYETKTIKRKRHSFL